MLHDEITNRIICAFYNVYNTLGHGFLEKVYENALGIELRKLGLDVQQQDEVTVFYDGEVVGKYVADIVVNGVVIVELKASQALSGDYFAQLRNYLKATGKEVGLLMNFGQKPEFRRIELASDLKSKPENHLRGIKADNCGLNDKQ